MTVDLALAKLQTRVTHTDEDTLLTQYIASSKAWIERYTGLLLEEGEVTDRFTEFGDYLQLSRGPFLELTGISYTDTDGDAQVVADSRYRDGLVYPPLVGWPAIEAYSTIEVTYLAGFDTYSPLPEELVQAQLLLISHFYENRSAVITGATSKEVEYAVQALAGPFRLPTLA